jgi:hypothetical protein
MASSSQVRSWWADYECDPALYTKVIFPGEGRTWSLSVARESAPIWSAVSQIMSSEPYLFRETAGGTYNCRPPSLHAYALALDLNPSKNPMKPPPLVYDYPESFITRMEGITANGHQALTWGGRWPASNPPDTMHWQVNVPPWDCDYIEWDAGNGGTMTWKKVGDPIKSLTDADAAIAYQGTFAPGQKEASYNPGSDSELNDRIWIVIGRIADWSMQIDQRLRAGGL